MGLLACQQMIFSNYIWKVVKIIVLKQQELSLSMQNLLKLFEGEGVFATFDPEDEVSHLSVIVRSNIDQVATIISSLQITTRFPYYITTKSNVEEFNLLKKSAYYSDANHTIFIQLGQKASSDITITKDVRVIGGVKTITESTLDIYL